MNNLNNYSEAVKSIKNANTVYSDKWAMKADQVKEHARFIYSKEYI